MQWLMHANEQPAIEGYSNSRKSPAALAATIGVHIIVAGAIILMPAVQILEQDDWGDPLPTTNFPIEKDPLPLDPPPTPKSDIKDSKPTTVDPVVDTRASDRGPIFASNDPNEGIVLPGSGTIVDPYIPSPPIVINAKPDARYLRGFQPDYPGTMIRAQMEGIVKVRVQIGTDGRVQSVELVEATNPAFWEATRKQALKYWRFKPATRDGVAITSEQVMTVRFRLDDIA